MDKCPTLVHLLHQRALLTPQERLYTFLGDGETITATLTVAELEAQARQWANHWHQLGVNRDRALLVYPAGVDFIAAFFGCLYAGVIPVPVSPPRPNRPLSKFVAISQDAQAGWVLAPLSLRQSLQPAFAQDPVLGHLRWLSVEDTDPAASENEYWIPPDVEALLQSDPVAYLQYTSGSTSTPKGVRVTHGSALHNLACIQTAFELTPESVSVSWLPHFHDMGLIDGILEPLFTGYPGVLLPPAQFMQYPLRWLQAVSGYRATHCGGPNFGYDLCCDKVKPFHLEQLDLSGWLSAYSGAEPVRRQTLERFSTIFAPCGFDPRAFYPCYGLAEVTLMVSGGSLRHPPVYLEVDPAALEQGRVQVVPPHGDPALSKSLVGCGSSRLGTEVAIVDPETLCRCLPNQVGEIWVAGPSVADGYWNRPEQTTATFRAYLRDTGEGPFLRTGDLGVIQAGELLITGRIKDLIIIRGRNVYPQDIELTVEGCHPALKPGGGAAFAIERNGEERLIVIHEVERTARHRLDPDEVIGNIRQAVIGTHEVSIEAVVLLKPGSIPKTSSGKISRQSCKAEFLAGTLDALDPKIPAGVEGT